jgi:5-methyltetrahydropteroyltriglutamate--homocysteine methyltransferase
MKRSTGRILTTHVGSLPRPAEVLDIVQAREQGKPVDEKAHAARLRTAVAEIVRTQIDLGVDVVDDGEFGKPSFVSYVNERLGGFEADKDMPRRSPWADSREAKSFPEFYGDDTWPSGRIIWFASRQSPTAVWRACRPTSITSRRR